MTRHDDTWLEAPRQPRRRVPREVEWLEGIVALVVLAVVMGVAVPFLCWMWICSRCSST